MQRDHLATDRQPEAHAVCLRGHERLEDALRPLEGDAGTAVRDDQLTAAIAWSRPASVTAAPGGVVFALLPPLPMLLGAALARKWPVSETVGAIGAWALLFLFWAPLLHLSEVLLDFPLAAVFALVSALIVLPALVEMKPLAAGLPRWSVPAGLGAVALAAWVAVALAPAYSSDRKQQFRIEYGWDARARQGRWLIVDDDAPLPHGFPGADTGINLLGHDIGQAIIDDDFHLDIGVIR